MRVARSDTVPVEAVPTGVSAELPITGIATVRLGRLPNVIWVRVLADELFGLGETFFIAEPVESYVHEIAAPYLIGQDALAIQGHWRALYRQWQRRGIGAEARAASAIDIALWDLYGKVTERPLYQLLGGSCRDTIPVYNTCAGPGYVRARAIPGDPLYGEQTPGGEFEDLWATHEQPVELARELLARGIRAMKVFPLDPVADETGGNWIDLAGLQRGLAPIQAIREAVGGTVEIALELRARWTLAAAKRIARAAEPYDLAWIEDPIRNDDLDALAEFARSTPIPTAGGENLGNRWTYRELLDRDAVAIVMSDPTWCGGVSETRRTADLAAMYMRPFAPHDCAGPVGLAVGTHLCLHAETAFMQEIVRAFIHGWYAEVADGLPELEAGVIRPARTPGHGVTLLPSVLERDDVVIRVSDARELGVRVPGSAFL